MEEHIRYARCIYILLEISMTISAILYEIKSPREAGLIYLTSAAAGDWICGGACCNYTVVGGYIAGG